MGRRYQNEFAGKKDIITYTVYTTTGKISLRTQDKEAAELAMKKGYKVLKTRENE